MVMDEQEQGRKERFAWRHYQESEHALMVLHARRY
jgi:hypothetical protein